MSRRIFKSARSAKALGLLLVWAVINGAVSNILICVFHVNFRRDFCWADILMDELWNHSKCVGLSFSPLMPKQFCKWLSPFAWPHVRVHCSTALRALGITCLCYFNLSDRKIVVTASFTCQPGGPRCPDTWSVIILCFCDVSITVFWEITT